MMLPRMAGWPKHFLYFSPTKVDALFAQITMRERRRIEHRLELDLKVFKGEISFTAPPENFYRKLRVVLDHLDRENAVGSVTRARPVLGWPAADDVGDVRRG